ncbi:hypothetical protein D3C85_1387690 [compost metagenome]
MLAEPIVLLVVLEGPDERRGGVDAGDVERRELMDLIGLGEAEDMDPGGRRHGVADRHETAFDLFGLQRNHAADCQIVVAHGDQASGGFSHTGRRPSLDHAQGRERASVTRLV